MSQAELSRISGLTRDHIGRIENGAWRVAGQDTIERIVTALEQRGVELIPGGVTLARPREDSRERSARLELATV